MTSTNPNPKRRKREEGSSQERISRAAPISSESYKGIRKDIKKVLKAIKKLVKLIQENLNTKVEIKQTSKNLN